MALMGVTNNMRFLLLIFIVLKLEAQTNVFYIYSSNVVINTSIIITNTAALSGSNRPIVLDRYSIERTKWENMLEQRRKTAFKAYLRRYR